MLINKCRPIKKNPRLVCRNWNGWVQAAPAIKWQYFLGADGGLGEYPAHRADAAAAGGLVDADVERRREP